MESSAECSQERGLAKARDAFQQDVTSRQQGVQDAVHDLFVPHDHLVDLASDQVDMFCGRLRNRFRGNHLFRVPSQRVEVVLDICAV